MATLILVSAGFLPTQLIYSLTYLLFLALLLRSFLRSTISCLDIESKRKSIISFFNLLSYSKRYPISRTRVPLTTFTMPASDERVNQDSSASAHQYVSLCYNLSLFMYHSIHVSFYSCIVKLISELCV
jgi:hypothetical protein